MKDNFEEEFRESNNHLIASCTGQWVCPNECNVMDIREDELGRDVVKYLCPICHDFHESMVYTRS